MTDIVIGSSCYFPRTTVRAGFKLLFLKMNIFSLISCLSLVIGSYQVNSVQVSVSQGVLEGELLELATGDGDYYSFKGVPYAASPVGSLRFKAPQSPVSWDGVRNATEHGAICPQLNSTTYETIGDEDCLFLNVYSKDINTTTPQPVMVFIHGGGYNSGSGNDDNYGPDFLVNYGVVLVTINYRLGALGFLCLDTEEVPGNAAMKDQVQALKWVQNNIDKFGGDPKNVTIIGQSAGGSSCTLHMLSPLSSGLFQRAICMSGVATNGWAVPFHPTERAFTLGKVLGFETNDTTNLLEFLQATSVEELVNAQPYIVSWEELNFNMLKNYHYTPVVEKNLGQDYFIIEDTISALKKGPVNDVDVLMGYTDEEALVIVSSLESILKPYDRYLDVIVPKDILIKSTPDTVLNVSKKLRNHFFGDKPINMSSVREAITYFSETTFQYGVTEVLKSLVKTTSSSKYMYYFTAVSERNVHASGGAAYGIVGTAHFDDLMYLFNAKQYDLPIEKNSTSYKIINQTCTLFTNFVKYGNPTPDSSLGVIWPVYDNSSESYLHINESLSLGYSLKEDSIAFWDELYEDAGMELY